jgi:hypothetical protein
MSEIALTIVRYLHRSPSPYLTTVESFLPQVLPSGFVPVQVSDPVMLLYPQSGQLTLSIGLLGIEAAISDLGYSGYSGLSK